MTFLIPLLSLVGPIYFGLRGYSLVFVLAWAIVWTVLRLLATWKDVVAALRDKGSDDSSHWLDPWLDRQHPYMLLLGVFLVTLSLLLTVHLVIYWIALRTA